jgi:hypothetical protein
MQGMKGNSSHVRLMTPRRADIRCLSLGYALRPSDRARAASWRPKAAQATAGAAAELDRKEVAYRTRRGLEGLAVSGRSTGGRAYGYTPATQSPSGEIEIHDGEAETVRRIFEMYSDGQSPRSIAARLNADGVPSPGASWRRKDTGPHAKRRRKWIASAIHGNVRRGSGILNNERYIGRAHWGRMHWRRGAAGGAARNELPSLWKTARNGLRANRGDFAS